MEHKNNHFLKYLINSFSDLRFIIYIWNLRSQLEEK
jgi:hypothetical protein